MSGFLVSLLAGGAAGTAVDVSLFPLDTVKTRLQAKQGFWAAGGFRGVYSGLPSVVAGSAPTAALFFCTYELTKDYLVDTLPEKYAPLAHMTAASLGETVACLVRVPTEVCKQRAQAGVSSSAVQAFIDVRKGQGLGGFYRGFLATVLREIPFAFIQFPIYEHAKATWALKKGEGESLAAWEAALCGSGAGAIAAAATTPLDVVKTRVMLGQSEVTTTTSNSTTNGSSSSSSSSGSSGKTAEKPAAGLKEWRATFVNLVKNEGVGSLFKGIQPRVLWISVGGAVFFGVYEQARKAASRLLDA